MEQFYDLTSYTMLVVRELYVFFNSIHKRKTNIHKTIHNKNVLKKLQQKISVAWNK